MTFWLERLDLAKWRHHKIEALSKGMSQKVQLIATVIARPKVVILDEPFSGLDPVNANVLRDSGPRAAAARRHHRLQHARHGRRRGDVRSHLHDLQGPQGARRHARRDPGALRPRHGARAHRGGPRRPRRRARRGGGERLRQPAGGAADHRSAGLPGPADRADARLPLRGDAAVAARHLRPHRPAGRRRRTRLRRWADDLAGARSGPWPSRSSSTPSAARRSSSASC